MADAPSTVEIPHSSIGFIIGPNGSNIKRLTKSTRCEIKIPRGIPKPPEGQEDTTMITISLEGPPAARILAAQAVKDVASGHDTEDFQARADGALLVSHNLEHRDRESWTQWKLTCKEFAFGIRTEIGRKAVRVFSAKGKLTGDAANKVRAVVDEVIQAAHVLVELEVEALLETDPMNANFDKAVAPLVDQYGVLLHIPLPEDGVVKLKLVGPEEPTRDAALLLEARYAKKKFTASILQASGQVQAMNEEMRGDWDGDMRNLESEYSVKVKESPSIIWVCGDNAEGVENAKRTLLDMLPFYLPSGFHMRSDIPTEAFNDFRKDPGIRGLISQPECAIQWDKIQGTAWICGKHREAVENRLNELMGKWESEHWEQELEDYGVAMWLLGPRGSGDFLRRMKAESGAYIKVCPNALKVWVESDNPQKLLMGKEQVLRGLESLEKKKKADEEGLGPGPKIKEVVSAQPARMQKMMSQLAMLEAIKDAAKRGLPPPKKLLRELAEARGLPSLDSLDKKEEEEAPVGRERSRSRDRAAPPRNTVTQEVMEFNPATGLMEANNIDIDMGPGIIEAAASAGAAQPAPAAAAAEAPLIPVASSSDAREARLRAAEQRAVTPATAAS